MTIKTNDLRTITNPDGLYNPIHHGYSFAASARGEIVFLAGHWAGDADGNVIEGDFAAQVDKAISNLGVTLAAEGLDYADVVRLGTFVVAHDMETLTTISAAITAVWGDRPPAQSLIPVPALALPGMRFEIEATAVRPAS